jgi:hypothetical protein
MARNILADLPLYAGYNTKREQITFTPWQKPVVNYEYTKRSTPAARDPRFEPWLKKKYLEVPHGFSLSFYANGVLVSYNKSLPVSTTW